MSTPERWLMCILAIVALVCCIISPAATIAQNDVGSTSVPANEWEKSYGNEVESVSNVIQTSDGGYAFIDYGWGHQTTMVPSTIYKVDYSKAVQNKIMPFDCLFRNLHGYCFIFNCEHRTGKE